MKELENPENYKNNFKDKCVSCGKIILADWENYKIRGNYCSTCNQQCALEGMSRYKENKKKLSLK